MKKAFVYIAGLIVSFIPMPQRAKDLIMWPLASRVLGLSYKQKVRLKEGFFMYGGMDDILLRQILFMARWKRDIWEPKTSKKLEEAAQAKHDIIIAGSHIGYLVLKAAQATEGTVHAFEPVEKLYEMSKENFALNPELAKKIRLNKEALGEEPGSIDLYVEDIRSSVIAYAGGHAQHNNVRKVPVTTIDEYAKRANAAIDLILLDIEGFEWQALNGAREVLEGKPDMILEVSPRILAHTAVTPEIIHERLEEMGYKTAVLDQDPDYANIYATKR